MRSFVAPRRLPALPGPGRRRGAPPPQLGSPPSRRRRIGLYATGLITALVLARAPLIIDRARFRSPPPTPLFEDARGGFLSDGEAVYGALGYWNLPEPIPDKVRKTVIAVEDRRFEEHLGVDPFGIARALVHTAQGRLEGGSTLAMQVVRLGYPRERTLLAKAEEAASALLATLVHGREAILRQYLKVLPEGGNMYGIAYAARRCFGKPVGDLSWAETALLLAVPQDPRNRALFSFTGFLNARARAGVILGQLADQGIIDRESLEAARIELAAIPPFTREERPANAYHYVFRVLENYAASPEARLDRPIRTSLDPTIQGLAARLVAGAMPRYRRLGADNMAVMVADARTGAVLAYLGSAGYFDEEHRGAIDYCRVPRSSGSTLKPFLYALGLQSGAFNPSSILADMPLRLKDARGEYSLSDFDDSYMGPLLYRKALGNSRNVPAIRVLEGTGLEECYRWLGRLGLHDFERPAEFYGYGLAVGGIYTSLDRLVAAYGCLASDGRIFPLRWLRDAPAAPDSRLISEQAARMISLFLSDTEARLPSFAGTALTHFPFPVAVKTGTSNGFRDAWALGYSRRYVAGVWIGHSDFRRMNHVAGSTAAEFLLDLFSALQPESVQGVDEELFPAPRGWVAARICPESGRLATEFCPHAVLERFPPGAEPRDGCPVHERVIVDALTGELAGPETPPARRAAKIATILGPEYAAYSLSRGYGLPGADPAALQTASVALNAPLDGTRVLVDPEIPSRFQTLALRATVSPAVPEIVWLVDGVEFARVPFPYEARWPLVPGKHRFQARFPHAFVESGSAQVTVVSE